MRTIRHLILPASLLLVGLLTTARAEVSVVADSPTGLTLEATFPHWTTVLLDDGVLHMPSNAGVDDRVGGEMTPYAAKLIGLPSGRSPRVVVEEIEWGTPLTGRAPQGISAEDQLPVAHLAGRGPVVVGEPFEWRKHQVAYLFIVPVRAEGDRIVPLSRLRVRIEFDPPQGRVTASRDPLVQAGVLNPAATSRWQQVTTSLKLPSTTSSVETWPSGTLVRIELEREGIYELTPNDLAAWGINTSGVDPRSFRIYGNGGQPVPESPAAGRDTSPRENAIIVTGENDGSFDPGDRILFYGRSVNSWNAGQPPGDYRHTNNPFTRINVYWLLIPDDGAPGLRMESLEPAESPTYSTAQAKSRIFVDNDAIIYNSEGHVESGKRWFASDLFEGSAYSASFEAPSVLTNQDGKLWVSLRTLGRPANEGTIEINGTPIYNFSSSVTTFSIPIPAGVLREGSNSFTFRVTRGRILFDWFEVSFQRNLHSSSGRMDFDALPEDGTARVTLTGLTDPWIFNIEQFDRVTYTRSNPFVTHAQVTSPRRHIAVSDGNFLRPIRLSVTGIGTVDYPNGLRDPNLAADYIMITHEDFYDASARLESYIEQRDGIEVLRVRVSDVYRDFSWGLLDPTAIRDFLAHAYANWTITPETVLLVGDGDYDYRNIVSNADKNWIPPYENNEDCRDDWFTTFESGGLPQMVSGRLTVQLNRELNTYIDKLIAYESNPDPGPWRSRMVLVADDEYGEGGANTLDQIHMQQAEDFARNYAPEYLAIKKVYIGTYPTSFDPISGGRRKPAATRELLDEINAGSLLINFIGHGNAHTWTHESVLTDSRDGALINSGTRNPIYIAATCSWGHFDRPENQSHPELLLNQSGGAIGVIAASRKTSAWSNFLFSTAFYSRFFDRINNFPLGTCLYLAKIDAPQSSNRYYNCLGEPLLRPALPRLDVAIRTINPDSLQALGMASVTGEVRTPGIANLPNVGFDGETLITVFDSDDTLSYTFTLRGGGTGGTINYDVKGGTLFRGNVSTASGEFFAQFVVPKDVKYGSRAGSVQMYAYNDEEDGIGTLRNLAIATTSAQLIDVTPPELRIRFDHENWMDGDMTSSQPTLYLDVFDTNGVNLTGEIGHDIKAVIDGQHEVVLTQDFIYHRDSYSRGTSSRTLYDLEPGRHRVEAWAWDNANNFNRVEATFVVVDQGSEVVLHNVLNYPNPFSDRTSFTFELSTDAEVTIRIFTASGRLIREIGPLQANAGFNYPEGTGMALEWDGHDTQGAPLANGVYLYKIKAKGASGQSDEVLGKLLRIR